jgi:hypothetical protein
MWFVRARASPSRAVPRITGPGPGRAAAQYCPRADPEEAERFAFKRNFNALLKAHVDRLRRAGRRVILVTKRRRQPR